jgi:hypothetical protein
MAEAGAVLGQGAAAQPVGGSDVAAVPQSGPPGEAAAPQITPATTDAAYNPMAPIAPQPDIPQTSGPESLLAKQIQYIEQSDKTDSEKKIAVQWAKDAFETAKLAAEATEKDRKEKADQASYDYTKKLMSGQIDPNIYQQIANDPRFAGNGQALKDMTEFVRKWTGKEPTASFGSDWSKFRARMLSSPDDPNHIGYNDFEKIYQEAAAGADITPIGISNLWEMRERNAKYVDSRVLDVMFSKNLKSAEKYLSFQGEGAFEGFEGLKDADGPHAIDQFSQLYMWQYMDLLAKAKETGDLKPLKEFMSEKNVKEMANSVRNQRKMDQDRIDAVTMQSFQPEAPGTPIPAPPDTIQPQAWNSLMAAPPTVQGKPLPHILWGKVLTALASDPRPEVIASFNKHFGPIGFDGAKIAAALNSKTAPPPAPSQVPASVSAPHFVPAQVPRAKPPPPRELNPLGMSQYEFDAMRAGMDREANPVRDEPPARGEFGKTGPAKHQKVE